MYVIINKDVLSVWEKEEKRWAARRERRRKRSFGVIIRFISGSVHALNIYTNSLLCRDSGYSQARLVNDRISITFKQKQKKTLKANIYNVSS